MDRPKRGKSGQLLGFVRFVIAIDPIIIVLKGQLNDCIGFKVVGGIDLNSRPAAALAQSVAHKLTPRSMQSRTRYLTLAIRIAMVRGSTAL